MVLYEFKNKTTLNIIKGAHLQNIPFRTYNYTWHWLHVLSLKVPIHQQVSRKGKDSAPIT